jgi:hypothetical protein
MKKLICSLCIGAMLAAGVCGVREAAAQRLAPVPATFCVDVTCGAIGAGCTKGALAVWHGSCECRVSPPGAPSTWYCHYSEWF